MIDADACKLAAAAASRNVEPVPRSAQHQQEQQQYHHFFSWIQRGGGPRCAQNTASTPGGVSGPRPRSAVAPKPHHQCSKSRPRSAAAPPPAAASAAAARRIHLCSSRPAAAACCSSCPRPASATARLFSPAWPASASRLIGTAPGPLSSPAGDNPWRRFGADAPARWQAGGSGDESAAAAAIDSAPGSRADSTKRPLFALPSNSTASMSRMQLTLLALGVERECERVGAPLSLELPPNSDASWSALEQVAPELQIWDELLAELCRQTAAQCSQRGSLLLLAVARQSSLLRSALCMCDQLRERTLHATATAEQHAQREQQLHQMLELAHQKHQQWQAACAEKQKALDAANVELQHQQDRMRRGRFHLPSADLDSTCRGGSNSGDPSSAGNSQAGQAAAESK